MANCVGLDPVVRTVMSLMARWGGNATLVTDTGGGTYDPTTSSTIPTVKQYTVRVIAEDYIQKGGGVSSEITDMIQNGYKRIFIKPEIGVPAPRVAVDYLLFQGAKWNIHSLKEYNPSGANVYLYEVYARQ